MPLAESVAASSSIDGPAAEAPPLLPGPLLPPPGPEGNSLQSAVRRAPHLKHLGARVEREGKVGAGGNKKKGVFFPRLAGLRTQTRQTGRGTHTYTTTHIFPHADNLFCDSLLAPRKVLGRARRAHPVQPGRVGQPAVVPKPVQSALQPAVRGAPRRGICVGL